MITIKNILRGCSSSSRLNQIPKAYNPVDFEPRILNKWKGRKRLSISDMKQSTEEEPFRMIFPPPNITGKLHLGHALTVAIEDAIVRLKIMRGHHVEWIPGFDHAGIATHSVVTRKLRNSTTEGEKIDQLLLKSELEQHALTNRANIKEQLNKLGALLDWNREYYTLDENHSFVVTEAFVHLVDAGVICRGQGLVNWCFALNSSVADIEVEEVEFKGRTSFKVPGFSETVDFGLLYHCAYPLQNSDSKLVIATSRPETMFGDVAVAANPSDSRHQEFIGKSVINPINGKTIPVIADPRVKTDFGTGLVKITPAHDKLDFAIGADHELPTVKIFTPDGHLNENCEKFQGSSRYAGRRDVIQFLKDSGSLTEVTEYNGALGICSRTQDIIEPLLLPHWFFQTKRFSEALANLIKNGEFIIRPDNMQNVFLHHMSLIHDWCLSRQIQWGHPIPAYFHQKYPEQWVVALNKKSACSKLEEKLKIKIENLDEIHQDPDVLDTWFSSALIPLALSNWPDVIDFKEISLMETGHDILLFWVWRMAIMNLALIDKLPFQSVLLHGIVIDRYGRKMSKSKGNVIDPMHLIQGREFKELIEEANQSLLSGELDKSEYELRKFALEKDYPNGFPPCGADAVRFALLGQDIFDLDVKISVDYLENCKHFCNKLWQAMRLHLHYSDAETKVPLIDLSEADPSHLSSLPMIDRWILSALVEFMEIYETNLRNCKFHLVTEAIRTFFYSQYCDVYLEFAKLELKQKLNVESHLQVMHFILCTSVKLIHPFMPFVTEEIWGILTEDKQGLLIDALQPRLNDLDCLKNETISQQMGKLIKLLKQVRSFKSRFFPKSKGLQTFLVEIHKDDEDIADFKTYIENLAKVVITFDLLGRNPVSDSVGVIFDLEGGRSCRISCPRADVGILVPTLDEVKLAKLEAKFEKLKGQYDRERTPDEAKKRLWKKIQSLKAKIEEASASLSISNSTDSNKPKDSSKPNST